MPPVLNVAATNALSSVLQATTAPIGNTVAGMLADDAITREYVYDENGRLRRYTDRNHRTTEYVYYATGDAAGLVQYERWFAAYANPDTATPVRTIEYAYTYTDGNLTGFEVDDSDVDFIYTYDAAGYLTTVEWDFAVLVVAGDDVTFTYGYDSGELETPRPPSARPTISATPTPTMPSAA